MDRNGLFLVLLLMSAPVLAQTANEVRENYNSARSLGMGGAAIAVVNDETALLVNPAGLGKLRDFYGTVVDPELDLSANVGSSYLSQSFTNPFEPATVQPTLDVTRETYYHARGQVFPSFVVRNFGIGVFAKYLLDAQTDATGATMQTYYQNDLSLLLGYNLRLWDGRIKIGLVGKAISRIEIDKALVTAGDLTVAGNASEGAALGGDVGIILTAPWAWLPTLSAVARDVGGTNFEAGSGLRMSTTSRPAKVDQDIDVAIAVFPIHSGHARSALTVEYQKMTAAGLSGDTTRYVHAGYEFNYYDLLFLRAGYNQRYWTAGLEIASEHTQIQLASYGEDVGPVGTPTEDRRYVFKFSFRF